jgi:rhamnosyltransferase
MTAGCFKAARTGTVAVVPLFNPDPDVVPRLTSLREQVDRLIVIDDGSAAPLAEHRVAPLAAAGVEYHRRETNRGIAASLNEGIRLARQDGSLDYLVTFDQDTTPADDCIRELRATFDAGRSSGLNVGIVAVPTGALTTRRDGFREQAEPIQSGMMMSSVIFDSIGEFREDFFIDCVDTEFALRARRRGWDVLASPTAQMAHQLGVTRSRVVRLPGFPVLRVSHNHHHPVRRYYIVRNRLRLYAEYFRWEPRWVLRSIRGEAHGLALSVFVSDVPLKQMCASGLGAMSFLTRRSGRISSRFARLLR